MYISALSFLHLDLDPVTHESAFNQTLIKLYFSSSKAFFCIRPSLELLPVLGLLEQYMTPTLDTALLCSSRAGYDLGRKSDTFE